MSKRTRAAAGLSNRGPVSVRRKTSSGSFKPAVSTTTIMTKGGATKTYVNRNLGNGMAYTERKYADKEYTAAIAVMATTTSGGEADPTGLALISPTQGDDIVNRDGRAYDVLSIKIRGQVSIAAQTAQTAADDPIYVRLLLVQDKQTNGGQLNSEDVMTSGTAATAPMVMSYQNTAFFGRFEVLKDKVITFSNPALTYNGTNITQGSMLRNFKINHTFKTPVRVHCNATNGGTVADITDNSFHLIAGAGAVTAVPTLSYKSRVVFIDP